MKHTCNRILSALLAVLFCVGLFAFLAAPVSAESGSCGSNLTWNLENGVLTISGSGAMTTYSEYNMAPWLAYADRIQRVIVGQGVTSISPLAFYCCENLTAASLADSVKTIGELAFAGCSSLRQISMGGVERLEYRCFHSCTALANVVLPQSLRYLGDEAFFMCRSLGGITIPAGVTYLGRGVFTHCDNLASVFIEAPLAELPGWIFYGCDALTVLQLPSSVQAVGDNAVVGCDSLYHVDYSGSSEVSHEISRQLAEPSVPVRGPDTQKDVTYSQTDNSVITTTNTTQSGGTDISGQDQSGTVVDATITGTGGWEEVSNFVNNAVNGGYDPEVNIWVQDDPTIPEGALDGMADQDVTVTVQTGDNMQWQIIMGDQTADSLSGEQQLGATLTKNESGAYSDTLGDADSYTVTLGSTSVNSTLLVPLGNETARQVATLYKKKGNKLEKLTSVIVDDQGRAAFSLAGTKEGDYVIALDVQDVPREEVVIPQALAQEYDITYGATLTDAYGNQYVLTGRVNKLGISLGTLTGIVIGILVGSAILVGVVMTLMNKKKQSRQKRENPYRKSDEKS